MIKIPSDEKKIIQSDSSDLFGNLFYTKSINLDEKGYIKLSSRTVAIKSEDGDTDFDLPISFGRKGTGDFYVVTSDSPYIIASSNTALSITKDTDTGGDTPPSTISNDGTGTWWQNRWYVTTQTKLYYKTVASGDWTDTGLTLGSNAHPLEVFVNKTYLAIGDGNTVKLYDTSHSLIITLTVPADFEVTGLSYCNNKLGIATRLSSVAEGQNKDAMFFVWDGADTQANGGYPVGSDAIVGVSTLKSSWVLITRAGQIKYFNGGGFEDFSALSLYSSNKIWGDSLNRLAFGDSIRADGSVTYLNISSELSKFGAKGEKYLESNLGGILCYDGDVGLYHRYAPSISLATPLTVAEANVNLTTGVFTKTTGTIPVTGNPIKFTSGSLGGVKIFNVYYVIKISTTQFRLAATRADAMNFVSILPTSVSGVQYFVVLDLIDYGISQTTDAGGIAIQDITTGVYDHLIFGGEYSDSDSTSLYSYICQTIDGFKNIGYFVTAKDVSSSIEDITQKVYVKYRPLKTEDSIIIKYSQKDALGIPVTTSQNGDSSKICNWTGLNTFTTTSDLSEVVTYLAADASNECEVEIISGAGAGQMSQISSIIESSGTYTITLDDNIEGAASGNKCDVLINNWKSVGTITSADTNGYKEFPIDKNAPWTKFKVILTGSNVTIEEFRSSSTEFLKA